MKDEIKINEEEIEKYCNEHNNMIYYSVSAKNDENVEEAFNKVAELAYNRNNNKNKEEELPKIKTVKIPKNLRRKVFVVKFKNII